MLDSLFEILILMQFGNLRQRDDVKDLQKRNAVIYCRKPSVIIYIMLVFIDMVLVCWQGLILGEMLLFVSKNVKWRKSVKLGITVLKK